MKRIILAIGAVFLCVACVGCAFSEKNNESDGDMNIVEMISGQNDPSPDVEREDPTDKIAVGTSPWKPEDITENPDLDGKSDSGMVSEGRLYFHYSDTEALLVDSKGSLTWLYSANKDIFAPFDSGDYVRVGHGMIMETYPGQTYITRIALIEDGDISSFSDEEWERLSGVFVDGLERK